jgi:hypothetical protein
MGYDNRRLDSRQPERSFQKSIDCLNGKFAFIPTLDSHYELKQISLARCNTDKIDSV